MSFRYILRYLIDPRFEPEQRMNELVTFCRESRIEEVMLFIAAEELSAGHPTPTELCDYARLGKNLKEKLQNAGIALSLNPWSTIYHNFRGRSLREGQNFRRMVGETGIENRVAVCPLCENWQEYLCSSFAMLVREIQPVTLWIEDDWRLRNHDRTLGWGGCFCDAHLQRFSERAGKNVDRPGLLEKILSPGKPHPWRQLWLDLSCETLLSPLARLSDAIRAASPATRVALMSSSPNAHSSEGRDWKRFQEAVGNVPTFLSRPTMGPYTQVTALSVPPSLTRLTIACLSGAIEIYPELENSPRCGPYSKSSRYSLWQTMNCAAIGSRGVTINHYDMLGNGLALDPDFGHGLNRSKKKLDALAAEAIDDRLSEGVEILFSPNLSRSIHTTDGNSLSELMQESQLWGDTCFILGIAHRYTSSIASGKAPVFVNGETLRAFTDDELIRLFHREVILDAASVEIALERGFGKLIGITAARWEAQRDCAFSYEEILEDDPSVYGIARPRMSAQRYAHRLLAMASGGAARPLTLIRKCDHSPLWPGSVLFQNELGGSVVSMAYTLSREAQFFMGYFNVFRRTFLQRLLFSLSPQARLAMVPKDLLHCYRTPTTGGLLLSLFNPTDDPIPQVTIDFPHGEVSSNQWMKLNDDGSWSRTVPDLSKTPLCDRLCFPVPLGHLEGLFLKWSREGTAIPGAPDP